MADNILTFPTGRDAEPSRPASNSGCIGSYTRAMLSSRSVDAIRVDIMTRQAKMLMTWQIETIDALGAEFAVQQLEAALVSVRRRLEK